MSFPAYPEYKDSGIAWLGEVPSHWDVKRLRFMVQLNPSKADISNLDQQTMVTFLPMEDIGENGPLSSGGVKCIKEALNGYTFFMEGDVVIAKITPCFENYKGGIMRGLINGIGFGTTELIVTRPICEKIIGRYLHWLYSSLPFRSLGEAAMYGAGGQKRVPDDFVRNFSTAFPQAEEQIAIAAFLDHETAKIDALIAEQEKLIELLKEKRQAVISHAVTKGLDPTVPMKDSGVEWLGQVPEHWKVVKLRRVVSEVQTGGTPSVLPPSFDEEDGIDWYTPADFSGAIRLEGATKKLSVEAVKNDRVKMFPKGAVLVVGIGATLGKTGYLTCFASANQQINAILPCDEICGLFLTYSLTTKVAEMRYLSNASTIGIMNQEKTKEIWIAVPPMLEQECIIKYLDADSAANDGLFTESQRAITLLKERRSALISAAVTGKIDVRGYAPQQEAV